jgi:hypothetical protein
MSSVIFSNVVFPLNPFNGNEMFSLGKKLDLTSAENCTTMILELEWGKK